MNLKELLTANSSKSNENTSQDVKGEYSIRTYNCVCCVCSGLHFLLKRIYIKSVILNIRAMSGFIRVSVR